MRLLSLFCLADAIGRGRLHYAFRTEAYAVAALVCSIVAG
jgi:hypothetical protein